MATGSPQDEASPAPIIRTKRRPIRRVLPLTEEEVRAAEGFDNKRMSAEWKILVESDEMDWLRSYLKVVLDWNAHYQRGKPRLWHFGPRQQRRSWYEMQQHEKQQLSSSPPPAAGDLPTTLTNNKLITTVNTGTIFFDQLRDMRSFYHDKIPLQPNTKSGQIIRAKLKLLDNIGFPWDIQADLEFLGEEKEVLDSAQQEWATYHQELQLYLQTRGDTMVPSHTELGIWCVQQRLRHSNGKLSQEQTEALAVLGFSFCMTRQVDWNDMYNELKAFREEWKHTCVWPSETLAHTNASPYASLARWCQRQRVEYQYFQETQKRKADATCNTEASSSKGKQPKKKGRGKKVRNCRLYEGPVTSTLTQELIDKLDALDFIWDTSLDMNWCIMFRQLQEYYKEHGHSNPKIGTVSYELPKWICNIRSRNKSEIEKADTVKSIAVTPIKKKLMSLVKFKWELPTVVHVSFEERFASLLEFREKEGHCLVPQLHPFLGEWVKHQRAAYAKLMRGEKTDRRLTADMIAKFDAIGFVWRLRHTSRGKHKNRGNNTTDSSSGVVDTTNNKKKITSSSSSKRKEASASSTLAKRRKATRKAEILEASSNEDEEDSEGNEASESEEEEDEQEEAGGFYDEEENNDTEEDLPTDGNNKGVVRQQATTARQNALAEMKCGLCSGIMVGATACVPCGHSFCETCLVLQLGNTSTNRLNHQRNRNNNCCTRCGSAIHDTVCQRHMDSIIYFTVEGGEFTPEETALFQERSNANNNVTTNHATATSSSISTNNVMIGDHAGGSNWNQQEQQQQPHHQLHPSEHYHTNATSYMFPQQQQQPQQQLPPQHFVSPRRRNLF